MTLFDYIDDIAAFCAKKSPQNECIFALTPDGELFQSEEAGTGHSFVGDGLEQIQFRGGASRAEIEHRLLAGLAWQEPK